MKKKTNNSLKFKNFKQSFIRMLENDFSILGSGQILDLLADNTINLIDKYMPERIVPGTTIISAISKEAPKGHHRGIKGLPQIPINLDVINSEIIDKYIKKEKTRNIKKEYVIKLFFQAYNQGGVLSSLDVATLLKMSSATISKYVREYINETGTIVPTRGYIHDIGPSISHKGIIVGKFLQGELPNIIARNTKHSQRAVDRYIKDYERIKICLKNKMETNIIHKTTGLSKKLINKYEELYNKYDGEKFEKQ
jgi:hypothetical protein